jgi:hypothetical protein
VGLGAGMDILGKIKISCTCRYLNPGCPDRSRVSILVCFIILKGNTFRIVLTMTDKLNKRFKANKITLNADYTYFIKFGS